MMPTSGLSPLPATRREPLPFGKIAHLPADHSLAESPARLGHGLRILEVRSRLHDGPRPQGGVAALEDPASHEHPAGPALHHQRRGRRRRDPPRAAPPAPPAAPPLVTPPLPTTPPSPPSCIISAASAGVAIPPAVNSTTGSRPSSATHRTRPQGARTTPAPAPTRRARAAAAGAAIPPAVNSTTGSRPFSATQRTSS